ncbi:unnamed protein product [Arabis nemorensis]|uniref:Inhibitor I9 domain-containing protein n=1 Tax=Arabis nemorensis TaxID=586526 RepID=A0A565C4Z4_9BRAS|nr:unnamed protein product [Arabis nemorensis]
MRNYRTLILVVLSLVIFLNGQAGAESKVHIVYLGEKQHNDPKFVTQSHHQMLWSLLGSKEDAHSSMVHSYIHGFSSFAAKLTNSQAKKIADLPEVVHVTPDSFYELATTRTWEYLGLSPANPNFFLNDTNMGVWPESEVFIDNGIGPVPSHWKGGCESGEMFNVSHCNKKLIGAKDRSGHGTHVSIIAGGSYVPNISYKGLAGGTVRRGAPRARIEMYKACWYLDNRDTMTCSSSDLLKAMDEAMHDETAVRDGIAIGGFYAVLKGITVVCSGGNSGPAVQTVTNTAPWILTVAATTLDRSFPSLITLGNNQVILVIVILGLDV